MVTIPWLLFEVHVLFTDTSSPLYIGNLDIEPVLCSSNLILPVIHSFSNTFLEEKLLSLIRF